MAAPHTDIAQRLYDSEINFSISCFWDGGFTVKIGDELNGFVAKETVGTYDEALAWLELTADEHYPKLGLLDLAHVGLATSCMNSTLQSTQEFWYTKLGVDQKQCGPWFFG